MVIFLRLCYIIVTATQQLGKPNMIISPYDINRTKHPQYDGLSFIECRLLDKRQMEEQEEEERRIKASDRTDWQAICVKAGFPLDSHEMFRPNSADKGEVSRAGVTSFAPQRADAPRAIRQVKDGYQLTDAEWEIISTCVPMNKGATAHERLFLDGILWSLEALALGLSWNYFPKEHARLLRWSFTVDRGVVPPIEKVPF
jgi:hypothetical protein